MDNNNQNKTNTMAILGFIFSFLFSLLGLIFSIIALGQIKERHEEGKGLAKAGLVISIIKMVIFMLMFIMPIIAFSNWGNLKKDILTSTYCSVVKECVYDESKGLYSCTYENDDGVEGTVLCDKDSIPSNITKSTFYPKNDSNDGDYEDPFDYDREF